MEESARAGSLLEPYRVLDLTEEKGVLCTKVLADLGADVIKIESLGGDPMRRIGPFYHDTLGLEDSLFWFAFNANKRSITLDIETACGRDIFKRLTKSADFVVECFRPGYMEGLGLGYPALSEVNPSIVMTSITPFGQTGPHKDYKGSDIVGQAMGGMMGLCGQPLDPPLRVGASQAYAAAGLQGAAATLVAHYHREATGEGQHVDVSMQASVILTLSVAPLWWDLNRKIFKRQGMFRDQGIQGRIRLLYPCRDGYIVSGGLGGGDLKQVIQWLDSEGMAQDLAQKPYAKPDAPPLAILELNQAEREHIEAVVATWMLTHTKKELYEGAVERQIVWNPLNTVKDIFEDPQLQARGFWQEVEHPELGSRITYPGTPYKLSETNCRIWRRPPLIGEHNEEIYHQELGISKAEMATLRQAGVI